MSTLYVLGGATGAGKTTWYRYGIEKESISQEMPFINIDVFILRDLDDYLPLLQQKGDLLIESNLSNAEDYDWIDSLRKRGYETVLFFFGTNSAEINKSRIKSRLLEGGHDIAGPIVEQRYYRSLAYLKRKLTDFTEATLIDVSGHKPLVMARLKMGRVLFTASKLMPWVKESLQMVESLESYSR